MTRPSWEDGTETAGHMHGGSVRGPGSTRKEFWLARRLQGTLEEEGERLAAAVRDGAVQGGSFTQIASFGLRRAFEDSPPFNGLTYSF